MQAKTDSNKPQNDSSEAQALRNLSYLLTIGGSREGLTIDSDGFALIDEISKKPSFKSKGITSQKLQDIVKASNEQDSYELKTETNEEGQSISYIRAKRQFPAKTEGSEALGQKIEKSSEISVCVHVAPKEGWKFIKTEGLQSITGDPFEFTTSHPVEESKGEDTNTMLIEINAEKAMQDGIEFLLTKDNKVLSYGIDSVFPAKYFSKAFIPVKGKKPIEVDLSDPKKPKGTVQAPKDNKDTQEEEKGMFIDTNPNLRGNHFKYICVLDFEAQCSNDVQLKVQEIIEFPVVVIDVEQMEIMETFHYYIKPVEYPQLFPFCTELTGITQDKVDNGIILEKALEELEKFLKEKGILDSSFCFLTCGDWDLNICLRKEAKAKNLPVRGYLKRWINIKKVYPLPSGQDNRKFGMTMLLKMSHLELVGRHHSGIDDSMNIARVAIYLLKTGFQFKIPMVAQVKY